MTYIFLTAGRGTRLNPLTLNYPKSMYKLDPDTTVLQRMIKLISTYDKSAKIVLVVGFLKEQIMESIKDVIYIENPFFEVTNSIASLWFARDYLDDQVTIINGDIVIEDKLAKDIFSAKIERPEILIDSSIKNDGDYNVQIEDDRILVMSKDLDNYYGEYAGITRLEKNSCRKLRGCIENMVGNEMYDQWYENALVQMIFNEGFDLYYRDIKDYKWTEVDCVDDMLMAKQIHKKV